MMAEIFGKKTGYCHGKGGSMHIADFENLNSLGANGIVGASFAIAAGSALASKVLGDAPISGGTPAAEAGTLAIMAGGDKEVFEAVRDILCMVGTPVYVGPCGSGSITKLVNNIIAGMNMLVIAEAYALGEKAGMDLPTIFEATRGGYAGGPVYENKVPKLIRRDYQPGARIAVHRKDIINAKKFAEKLDVSLPVTDVLLQIMDWMMENGYGNEDQIAMVKYYENSMKIKIGNE